jgi:hypothetical protein
MFRNEFYVPAWNAITQYSCLGLYNMEILISFCTYFLRGHCFGTGLNNATDSLKSTLVATLDYK